MLEGGGRPKNTIFVFYAFSDKFLYINYFNPSYRLKDINFISLIQFKTFTKAFLFIFIIYLILILLNFNTDQWVPLVSHTLLIKLI